MKNFLQFTVMYYFVICITACQKDYSLNQNYSDFQKINNNAKEISTQISIEKATNIASKFLSYQAFPNLSSRSERYKETECSQIVIPDDNGNPTIYVINYKDGGYVLVSATRNYYPILAFSDKGVFQIPKEEESNGSTLWLNATKESIINCITLNDSIKADIQALWNHYDMQSGILEYKSTSSTPEAIQACWNRLYELEAQHTGEGWTFTTLESAESIFSGAGYSNTYNDLCISAEFNNSPLNCSVLGWRLSTYRNEAGPFIATQWGQNSPFDNLMDGEKPGCAAVAAAQVMKYYEHPQTMTLNGYSFSWNNIPINVQENSDQPWLMKLVSIALNTHHVLSYHYTTPSGLINGLNSLLYNVRENNFSADETTEFLYNNKKPIIMLGNASNLSWIPGEPNLEYIGNSHYWICDGALTITPNILEYFTEWQPYGNGTFVNGWYTANNPGRLQSSTFVYYHMNWGWKGNNDGWYGFNDVNSGNGNFEHSRVNFYISKK